MFSIFVIQDVLFRGFIKDLNVSLIFSILNFSTNASCMFSYIVLRSVADMFMNFCKFRPLVPGRAALVSWPVRKFYFSSHFLRGIFWQCLNP